MKLAGVALSIFTLVNFLPGLHAQQRAHSASPRGEQAVMEHLQPVLSSIGKGARIDYRGTCGSGMGDQVFFPEIATSPPSKLNTGLVAVREIFRNNEDVIVTAGHSGVVRIKIGRVPESILQVRIPILTLTPLEQYDPAWTVYAVENTKEIKSAARKLGIRSAPFSPGLANILTPPGSPHLPSSLKNVTVDQVLELTAEIFKGVVFYGVCTQRSGQNLFRLGFVDTTGGGSKHQGNQYTVNRLKAGGPS